MKKYKWLILYTDKTGINTVDIHTEKSAISLKEDADKIKNIIIAESNTGDLNIKIMAITPEVITQPEK